MKRRALIVSHADADGHLIAEQTRRNLDLIPSFDVRTIVDPEVTKDHKVWHKLNEIGEINDADFIFFVDLMFSPASFSAEARSLTAFVNNWPDKKFFLIDHHPLPLYRLEAAENLRLKYRPEVFDCVIGPRSGMMIVAALCERQHANVSDIRLPGHDLLAVGVRRAAALGGPLPGEKLLALLRSDCWEEIANLGRDAPEHHRLPRGRRPRNQPLSDTLSSLNATAESLLRNATNVPWKRQSTSRRQTMAYDMDAVQHLHIGDERFRSQGSGRARLKNTQMNSRDLEVIITLLEVAALSLTTEPDARFSLDQLVREAQELGGDEIVIDEKDVKIVLEKASFVQKVQGRYCLR